ncbi:A24 family peptidase [Teredinibacter sp. KSP-S5-2]|uniref:prepilin peptidase n=1 Tax=Teredinibacter sp. KSP-S5-2 TaxID=3034506 RepID=UPI0029343D4E|nr:A24 family peptidase [Teredinibacter sp. KSP-S5-2]WNO09631.1 A24 family peptidase [Teredinibacter sp. KSP-S5-2]
MTIEILFSSYALLIGLIVGSFLNVIILRLPIMLKKEWKQNCQEVLNEIAEEEANIPLPEGRFNIAYPRSHCPKCKKQVSALENIPVLSYLFLKGQCSGCHTKISPRYPIVELITGLLTGYCIYTLGANVQGYLAVVLSWALVVLTLIDADTHYLPDDITLPLLWIGLLANTFGVFVDLQSAVIGAAAGYLSLWSVYWVFKFLTKKEGMGYGDFKLLAALGAWMGWQMLPFIIIASAFVGAAIGIAGIIFYGKDKDMKIPYGPYLATAGWIAFFWGNDITQAYLQYMGS